MKTTNFLAALAATLVVAMPAAAKAEVRLLLQTDVDSPTSEELYLLNYSSPTNFVSGAASSSFFLPTGTGSLYTVAGLTEDHGAYRMLLETRADSGANQELYLLNYGSYADFVAGNEESSYFLPLNIGSYYTVAGLTEDNGAYRLLLETRDDAGANEELYLFNYASFADFVDHQVESSFFLPFNVGAFYSVGGFAHDNGAYRFLLERNDDAPAGEELYLFNYASYDDFIGNHSGSDYFLPFGTGPAYSVAAFVFEQGHRFTDPGRDPREGIPEPASWVMMILGFGAVGSMLRRRPLLARA